MAFLLGEAVAGALEVDCQAGEPHAEGGGSVVNSLADVVIDTVTVVLAWPVIWAPVPAGIMPDGTLDSRLGSLDVEPALNRRSFRPYLVHLLCDVAATGDLVVEGSERHCLPPFIADYLCQ